jgi:hypothetical protein
MLYRFWQFSRQAQIEQYLFSVPMILTPPEQAFPVAVRELPYLHTDLKSRKLMIHFSLLTNGAILA